MADLVSIGTTRPSTEGLSSAFSASYTCEKKAPMDCAAGGCPNQAKVGEWCGFHYDRLRNFDQVDLPTVEQRFWRNVDKTGDCWIWTGERQRTTTGAGIFRFKRRKRAAHHVSWILAFGELPVGVHLRHSCAEPLCVRPDHLTYRRRPKPKPVREYEEPTVMTCSECGETKPTDAFSPNSYNRRGRQSYCRDCGRARRRIGKGVHPDDARRQCPPGQTCEICGGDGGKRGLFLDHDHTTGRFRGWLCNGCNTAIGHLADDPLRLHAAIEYLRSGGR